MEYLGATAAALQLVGLAVKAADRANDAVAAFVDAPAQLVALAAKLDRLRCRVQDLQKACDGLPSDDYFPPSHRALVDTGLRRNVEALERLKTLCAAPPPAPLAVALSSSVGLSPRRRLGVRQKLRWAAVDKRRAARILDEVRAAETEIDSLMDVLAVCVSPYCLPGFVAADPSPSGGWHR